MQNDTTLQSEYISLNTLTKSFTFSFIWIRCVTRSPNYKFKNARYEPVNMNQRQETSLYIQIRQQKRARPSSSMTQLNMQESNIASNTTDVKELLKSPIITGVSVAAIITAVSSVAAFANPAFAKSISLTAASANTWLSSVAETGFYQAFSLVFVSEIGDKTFFIAGLLAMKTSKFISFLGSMGALAVMTIISVCIGQLFHAVPTGLIGDGISIPWDDVAAVAAFAFFGIKTLRDALAMEDGSGGAMGEELEEAKQVVDEQDTTKSIIQTILGIFGLVFAAEFGDRSFISTIALSAAQNPISVAGGAIAAHAAATGLAVSGGAVIAKYLSEKVIGIVGGTLFIVFAITTALGIF
jgi:putative Ca2+/H+ antiporter (TMEM165/GDT1 family)